jgi:hypothetical protein
LKRCISWKRWRSFLFAFWTAFDEPTPQVNAATHEEGSACYVRVTGILKPIDKEKNMEQQELDKRFTYHAPKGDQPAKYEQIRRAARNFSDLLNQLCPDSREKSLAFTSLEEAVMWANAAIARNE